MAGKPKKIETTLKKKVDKPNSLLYFVVSLQGRFSVDGKV